MKEIMTTSKRHRLPKIEGYVRMFGLYVSHKRLIAIFSAILVFGFLFIEVIYPPLVKLWLKRQQWPEIIINSEAFEEYSGKAHLISSSGELIYSGDVAQGTIEGKGKLYQNSALIYEGEFLNNMYEGQGKLYSNDGTLSYDGGFAQNCFSGKGTLYIDEGRRLEGEFSDGEPDGAGKEYYFGSLQYEGEYISGMYSGKGKLYENGSLLYEGGFAEGSYDAEGILYNPDSGEVIYEGGFSKGEYSGEGRLYRDGNLRYEGSFRAGKYEGEGKQYVDDWLRYDGEWTDGEFDGAGKLYKGFSLIYEGEFAGGKYNGQGREYYPGTGYLKYEGIFLQGEYLPSGQSYDEDGRPINFKPLFDLAQMKDMLYEDLLNLLFDKELDYKEMELGGAALIIAEDVGMIFRLGIDLKSGSPDRLIAVYYCGLDAVADVLVGMPTKDVLAVLGPQKLKRTDGLSPEETLALTVSNSIWGNSVEPDSVSMMEFELKEINLSVYYEDFTVILNGTPTEDENAYMGNSLFFKVRWPK